MLNGIKISKDEFNFLDEKDVVFITNPGRMGDEDGSTFIIKQDNKYIVYRVDGWMHIKSTDNLITLDDMFLKFPMWEEMLTNNIDKSYVNFKYEYIYMGFGNGLSVDKNIYNEFNTYLIDEVKNDKHYNQDENSPSLKYITWVRALNRFAENNNIEIVLSDKR